MEGVESSVPVVLGSDGLPLPSPVVAEGGALPQVAGDGDVVMQEEAKVVEEEPEEELPPRELLFRCLRCKRGCHYAHREFSFRLLIASRSKLTFYLFASCSRRSYQRCWMGLRDSHHSRQARRVLPVEAMDLPRLL